MPRESQAEKLAKFRDRVEGARDWRESQGYISLWRRMIDMYRGKQVDNVDGDADMAMVNLSFSVLNIIVASCTTQYPKFTVAPNQMDQGNQATIAEAVLNYAWQHYNFQSEYTQAVIDMCMVGHGWLKVGWKYREHSEDQVLSPEDQALQVQGQQATTDLAAMLSQVPQGGMTGPGMSPGAGMPGALVPAPGLPGQPPGGMPGQMPGGVPGGMAGGMGPPPPDLGMPGAPPAPGVPGMPEAPGMPGGPDGMAAMSGMGAPPVPAPAPMPAMPPIDLNAAELPSDQEIEEGVQLNQKVTVVDEDDPFVERVSPFDVIVDPEATCERDLRWIAQRVVRDLKEVQDDESYETRARHAVTADMSTSPDDVYTQGGGDAPEDGDRVTIWEFYDLVEKQWAVFAQAGDGFLVKPSPIPYEFDQCFIQFRDYDVPDTFYPIGEIESVETLQQELNKTRTQQINARKQYVRKFIGREAALSPAARTALTSEIDGDVALIEEDDRPLTDILIPAPSLNFDPQIFIQHSGQIVTDLQMVTGLSDYQFGQMPDTRRLATEAMAVEGSTNARASAKLTRVERTLAVVGRRLLQTMQQYLDTQRVARISGPGGEMLFTYQPDDIRGEFDLEVQAGSTQPKNDMIRRQEAVTLFNTLAPFMGALVDPQNLITYLLTQGYDIKGADRFLMPPPPPAPVGPDGQPLPPGQGGQPGQEGAPAGGAPGSAPPAGGPTPPGGTPPGLNGTAAAPPVPVGA